MRQEYAWSAKWLRGKIVASVEYKTVEDDACGRMRDVQQIHFTDGTYLVFMATEPEDGDAIVEMGYVRPRSTRHKQKGVSQQ